MSKLLVIVGSTRPARTADRVVPWIMSRASAHDAFGAELADLRDWPLPIFAEHPGTIGDVSDPTYSEPVVRAWNKKVERADAFIVVTPEYNHRNGHPPAGHAGRPRLVVVGAGEGPGRRGADPWLVPGPGCAGRRQWLTALGGGRQRCLLRGTWSAVVILGGICERVH